MGFLIPNIVDNPEGWGPCNMPEEHKDIPYAPFSKSDKLGRASDWINQGYSKYNCELRTIPFIPL
jgi:translation initiation factor 3 subunit D